MTSAIQADILITNIAQLATASGPGPKFGGAMRDLNVTDCAALAIANGLIVWAGRQSEWYGHASRTINAGGRAVVPALVDPHTHAVWAGDRLDDFDARTSGSTYEEILLAGGGIRNSIRASAAATLEELVSLAQPRIAALLHSGAATIEVKSGYGFSPAAELKMLEAIHALRSLTPARLVATLLIHIPPAEQSDRQAYIASVCNQLIPDAASRRLASAVDVFVEREAWRAEEAATMLSCAQRHGLAIKLHTEQFHSAGGLKLGLKLGALSVDHLEACTPNQFALFAAAKTTASKTIATILPGASLHLGIPAAPGRRLIDAGAAVAVGTDLNPGSSPLYSMAAALALAVRLNGLSPAEALVAGTVNAAAALGLSDTARLQAGLRADFLILEANDWRDLIYTLGANPVREVWVGGININPSKLAATEAR